MKKKVVVFVFKLPMLSFIDGNVEKKIAVS